jgi:hypothetical protein
VSPQEDFTGADRYALALATGRERIFVLPEQFARCGIQREDLIARSAQV